MSKSILNAGLRASALTARFLLLFILATFLPPRDLGLYGLFTATIAYAVFIVGFDFYAFSTRDIIARNREEWPPRLASQLFLFLIGYGVMLPASCILFASGLLPWWVAGWFLPLLVSEHLSQELSRLHIAIGSPLRATGILCMRQAVWVPPLVLLMWLREDYRTVGVLFTFWLVGSATSVVLGAAALGDLKWKGAFLSIDWAWIRKGLRIALPLLCATLALRAVLALDRYAFEALNGLDLLGAYSLYIGIAGAMLSLMDAAVFSFKYPELIQHWTRGDTQAFRNTFKSLVSTTIAWTGLMAGTAVSIAPILFSYLPAPIYAANSGLFFALIAAMSVLVLSMIPHYGLYSSSRDRPIVVIHGAALLVFVMTILLTYAITPYWSVPLALGVAFGFMGMAKLRTFRAHVGRFPSK